MQLLVATPSPFARKARIALLEKGIPFEVVVDNPWNPGAQAPAHNPLGKIPVLFTDDGNTVFDSRVIVEYLEAVHPARPLLPADALDRAAARQIEALADGVCDAIVLIVLERARPPALQSRDWIARQLAKVRAGVGEAARALGGRKWFIGATFSLADIAAGCMLGYLDLRLPEVAWRGAHPCLIPFFERIMARDSFKQTIPSAQPINPVT
jgi:glutathione S-transferase